MTTAILMGMPALLKEGMSWREVRLRAMHATPVKLPPRRGKSLALAGRVPGSREDLVWASALRPDGAPSASIVTECCLPPTMPSADVLQRTTRLCLGQHGDRPPPRARGDRRREHRPLLQLRPRPVHPVGRGPVRRSCSASGTQDLLRVQRLRRERPVPASRVPTVGGGDLRRHRPPAHRRGRRPGADRRDQAADGPDSRWEADDRRARGPCAAATSTSTRCTRECCRSPSRPSSGPSTPSRRSGSWPRSRTSAACCCTSTEHDSRTRPQRLTVSLAELTTDAGVDLFSFGGTKNGMLAGEAVGRAAGRSRNDHRPGVSAQADAPARVEDAVPGRPVRRAPDRRAVARQRRSTRTRWRHASRPRSRLAPALQITRPVQANVVFATLPAAASEALQRRFAFYMWNEAIGEVRWMCSWDTTEEDVDEFADGGRRRVRPRRALVTTLLRSAGERGRLCGRSWPACGPGHRARGTPLATCRASRLAPSRPPAKARRRPADPRAAGRRARRCRAPAI